MKRSLTPTQAGEVWRAASALPPTAREGFFAAVDARLVGIRRQLNDDDVNAAIIATLGDTNIATTTHCFMCDGIKETTMARYNADDDDENPFDRNGILKDGRKVRIPLHLRDAAMTRNTAASLFDSRRPGPIYTDRSAAARAYQEMCDEATNAWRNPAPMFADVGEGPARGARAGDVCTIDGRPGRLNAKLECVTDDTPVPRSIDAATARQIKKDAYDLMCQQDREAWRNQ